MELAAQVLYYCPDVPVPKVLEPPFAVAVLGGLQALQLSPGKLIQIGQVRDIDLAAGYMNGAMGPVQSSGCIDLQRLRGQFGLRQSLLSPLPPVVVFTVRIENEESATTCGHAR